MSVRRSDVAVTALVTVVVLGPLLAGRGFWLVGDMVFVPEQPWKAGWLGLDGALPRAVPMDAIVSAVSQLLPGDIVQKLLLTAGFVAGGLGIARLVGEQAWFARAAAITLFCWNPWVHERLMIGQWAILLGYFGLPWVAHAALRLRADPRRWGPGAVALVLSAACGPSSGVMAAGVFAALGLGRNRSVWWRGAVLVAVANMTWLVPGVTASGVEVSTDGVFDGFAARAESGAGTAASLLSLGGIWKSSILAGERTSVEVVLLSCALSLVALLGLWRSRERRWLAVGAGAFGLAILPALPGGTWLLEGIGSQVPAVALLRDSHRFLAPLGVALAVGLAHAVSAVRARIRPDTRALWSVVGLIVVAPPLLLPSLAWGGLGELDRVDYPHDWSEVAALVGEDDVTVVLPWSGSYRGFDWNARRAVLDPAPRLLAGVVLTDDSIHLVDRVVPGEDARTRPVTVALDAQAPAGRLRDLGVRWVLVEQGMDPDLEVPSGRTAYDGGGLQLIDLSNEGEVTDGASTADPMVTIWRRIFVGSAHACSFLLLLAGCTWILRTRE